MPTLSDNYQAIMDTVALAAQKSGRSMQEVSLVAVTKTVPASVINEGAELYHTIGENKAQELMDKAPLLDPRLEMHFIGHLQTNKVKYIVDKAALIHSVDHLKLAKEIDRLAEQNQKCQKILLEINVSGEPSKFGASPEEACKLAEEVLALPHIRLCGLMTIAPYTLHPEESRIYFERLRRLLEKLKKELNIPAMTHLSMGMSGDYGVAVEEGATLIRVGSALFGQRS